MRTWGLIAMLGVLALAAPAAASTKPALKLRSVEPFSIRGTHFKALERVTVTLNGQWVRRARADADGTFIVTFKGVSVGRCDGFRVTAVGSKGTTATLRRPPLMCATTNPG